MQYVDSVRAALGPIRQDVNALWDLGAHDASIFLDLLPGRPSVVTAIAQDYLREGHPDVVYFAVRFDDGVLAHSHVSWLDPYKVRRVTVVGEERMAVFDDVAHDERAEDPRARRELRRAGPGGARPELRRVPRRAARGHDHDPAGCRAASRCRRSSRSSWPRCARVASRTRGSRRRATWCACSRRRSARWRTAARRSARPRVSRARRLTPRRARTTAPTRNSVERPRVSRSSGATCPAPGATRAGRPAVALHRLDDVAPGEPAQVRPVAVAPLRVAERPPEDEVLHQRHVPRVGQRDLQPRARRGEPRAGRRMTRSGSTRCSSTSRHRIVSKGPSSCSSACSTGAATTSS